MTAEIVPAFAQIREYALAISAPTDSGMREPIKATHVAPGVAARWRGRLAFAALARMDLAALVAFFEACDGRAGTFAFILPHGVVNHPRLTGVTFAADVVPQSGADKVAISASEAVDLRRGFRFSTGGVNAVKRQVLEVAETVRVTPAGVLARVSPRVQVPITAGGALIFANVYMRARLLTDAWGGGLAMTATHGSLAVDFEEDIGT